MSAAVALAVRAAAADDSRMAAAASRLIDASADEHDIARRTPDWLEFKIRAGQAAVALAGEELVGFGYWSQWEGGRWVSHSALVVRADRRGEGLGRRLKTVMMESSRAAFPGARLFSLTSSPAVVALNLSLGFRPAPLESLTQDPEFWACCATCRNFEQVRARGERCCCQGMIFEPDGAP